MLVFLTPFKLDPIVTRSHGPLFRNRLQWNWSLLKRINMKVLQVIKNVHFASLNYTLFYTTLNYLSSNIITPFTLPSLNNYP